MCIRLLACIVYVLRVCAWCLCYMCSTCVRLVLAEVRRQGCILWNWNYRWCELPRGCRELNSGPPCVSSRNSELPSQVSLIL